MFRFLKNIDKQVTLITRHNENVYAVCRCLYLNFDIEPRNFDTIFTTHRSFLAQKHDVEKKSSLL